MCTVKYSYNNSMALRNLTLNLKCGYLWGMVVTCQFFIYLFIFPKCASVFDDLVRTCMVFFRYCLNSETCFKNSWRSSSGTDNTHSTPRNKIVSLAGAKGRKRRHGNLTATVWSLGPPSAGLFREDLVSAMVSPWSLYTQVITLKSFWVVYIKSG